MRILGIETSCDETAAAVVEDGTLIRSNIVASQIPVHQRFGGVVPEIASRQHILAIAEVAERALQAASTSLGEVDAVGVTYGPGLSGALLVGVSYAKGLTLGSERHLMAVNHVEGHILSLWLSGAEGTVPRPRLPMVVLVVSGGHTELVLVRDPGDYRILGRTLDDAVGEAFDKVGRLLGLPYPGGPAIERCAAEPQTGEDSSIADLVLPRSWLTGTYDFSFSGLKTAVMREVRSLASGDAEDLDRGTTRKLAQAFQESVADVLSTKLAQAAQDFDVRSAGLVGGVANNEFIRSAAAERLDVPLHVPGPGLSSDNAAMIAGAVYWNPHPAGLDLEVVPSLALDVR